LTFAARQKYIRTEGLNYKEDESIQTENIDYDSTTITW
jgi:hypothetical protein